VQIYFNILIDQIYLQKLLFCGLPANKGYRAVHILN